MRKYAELVRSGDAARGVGWHRERERSGSLEDQGLLRLYETGAKVGTGADG